MALKVRWTKRAHNKLVSITNYSESEFGRNITKQIIKRIFNVINIISEYPEIGTVENKNKLIKGITVTRHNKVFYRIDFKRGEVVILNIFDNRSIKDKY